MPGKILIAQIGAAAIAATGGIWAAAQWTADGFGYDPRLGAAWFDLAGTPVYPPWWFFGWWLAFGDAAPRLFDQGGLFAVAGGLTAGHRLQRLFARWRLARTVVEFKTPTLRNVAVTAPRMHTGCSTISIR